MSLLRLDITDFRNLVTAKIDPLPQGFNLFYGKNGSGKTSLLEAVYYLGRGRSFRSTSVNHIVNNMAEKFAIFAQIQTKSRQSSVPIGVERQRNGDLRIRIAGQENNSFAELLDLTPALLINSSCFDLLDGGPVFRRKYLDWGAFYLTNDFLRTWKMYERALKQRNEILRERGASKELAVWTAELVRCGLLLDGLRREFVSQLLPFLQNALAELVDLPDLKWSYYPGWEENLAYQEAIDQFQEKDRGMGYTQIGPHRADLKLFIKKTPVKDILSRGQQKLFICAMMVAQGALLHESVNRKPIYLIDDLPAELDSNSRVRLMELLTKQEAQVFLTAVEREALVASYGRVPIKMFHVEHGSVREENQPGCGA